MHLWFVMIMQLFSGSVMPTAQDVDVGLLKCCWPTLAVSDREWEMMLSGTISHRNIGLARKNLNMSSDTVNPRLSNIKTDTHKLVTLGKTTVWIWVGKQQKQTPQTSSKWEKKNSLTDQNKDPKKHCPSSVLHVIKLTAQIIHWV